MNAIEKARQTLRNASSEAYAALTRFSEQVEAADKTLQEQQVKLCLPAQEYTLNEAVNKLAAVLGNEYFTITPPTITHHNGSMDAGKWSVYHARESVEAPTLASAVNAMLALRTPAAEDSVGEVEKVLAAATATA